MQIEIVEIKNLTPELSEKLLGVWQSSVEATHAFLSPMEIQNIGRYVPSALGEVPRLIVAENEGAPVAFAGVAGRKLEMLFVAAQYIGRGIGGRLLGYAMDAYAVNQLAVNEQNPRAAAFYEHMGFEVCGRSERDEQGGPYPVLYMRRRNG